MDYPATFATQEPPNLDVTDGPSECTFLSFGSLQGVISQDPMAVSMQMDDCPLAQFLLIAPGTGDGAGNMSFTLSSPTGQTFLSSQVMSSGGVTSGGNGITVVDPAAGTWVITVTPAPQQPFWFFSSCCAEGDADAFFRTLFTANINPNGRQGIEVLAKVFGLAIPPGIPDASDRAALTEWDCFVCKFIVLGTLLIFLVATAAVDSCAAAIVAAFVSIGVAVQVDKVKEVLNGLVGLSVEEAVTFVCQSFGACSATSLPLSRISRPSRDHL